MPLRRGQDLSVKVARAEDKTGVRLELTFSDGRRDMFHLDPTRIEWSSHETATR